MDRRPPETVLDDPATYALDRSGMFGHIANVGPELERAWARSAAVHLPDAFRAARAVVVAGIGGSATAGDYFAAIALVASPIPVLVVQGYQLPAWVGPETLVVVCSYSGNTAESLAAYEAACARGAMILAITGGGEMGRRCLAAGQPIFPITYLAPPRATTVHSLAPLLRVGQFLGLTDVQDEGISAASHAHKQVAEGQFALHVPFKRNPAKQLAAALYGRFAYVLGAGHLAAAAVRFKNQLAENGKTLAAADFVPEIGHNLVVGLATAARSPERYAAVALRSPALQPQLLSRLDAVIHQFRAADIDPWSIALPGESILADLLLATAWGDYVSCFVAMLNGEDPTPIPQIEQVRAHGS